MNTDKALQGGLRVLPITYNWYVLGLLQRSRDFLVLMNRDEIFHSLFSVSRNLN